MRQLHSNSETEIKLKLENAAAARRALAKAGFRISRRKVFESNTVYDNAAGDMRRTGTLLRLRRVGNRAVLTYKGVAQIGKHKTREELEFELSDPGTLHTIFTRLGFQPCFVYEKFRTEFRHRTSSSGVVTLDETPIGDYLELEGAPRWIDRTARSLGYRESDYITASYSALYLEFCKQKGIQPCNMTFAKSSGNHQVPSKSRLFGRPHVDALRTARD